MADYFTKFAVDLPFKDQTSLDNALSYQIDHNLRFECDEPGADEPYYCALEPIERKDSPYVWARLSDDGANNIDAALELVQHCARQGWCAPQRWVARWSETCSSARPDGFGGGLCLMDLATGEIIHTLNLTQWSETLLEDPDMVCRLDPHVVSAAHDALVLEQSDRAKDPNLEEVDFSAPLALFERLTQRETLMVLQLTAPETVGAAA